MDQSCSEPTRRAALAAVGIAFVIAAIAPRLAVAKPSDVEAELKKLFADKTPVEGRIKLDLPAIAENGLVVPLGIEVESPMTEADFVKAVHIWADGNPQPGVVSFFFTAASGKAAASTRMRLAQTQNIIAVAEMSDGKLFTAKQEVKVTIGGCGG
ncbi:MAG: thiosulfate oxidation carrier protein SoxY [Bosea sp. (in: a-proteobacteria)]